MRAKFRLSVIAFLLIISLLLVPVNAVAAQVEPASAADSDFKLGDADGDGDVTIMDATAVQRFLAQLSVLSFNEAAADTDSNGDIEITDATRIRRFIAGMCNIDGSHIHTPADPVRENVIPATCTKHGSYDEVVYCSACGEELSRTSKTIPKLSHTPAPAVIEDRHEASCKELGYYYQTVYCSSCGVMLSRNIQTLSLKKHNIVYVDGVPITETRTETTEELYAHYKCTTCGMCFYDENGEVGVTAEWLVGFDQFHTHVLKNADSDECAICGKTLFYTLHGKHYADLPVKENIKAESCTSNGTYEEAVYCTYCGRELSRTLKELDGVYHTLTKVKEVPATTTTEGTKGHYKCSVCNKLFSDKDGKNEVTAASLVIPKITQVDPKTCSHHWVKYVIPYNYEDLYKNHRSEIPFTNDNTKNTLKQTNMEALFQHGGWAIYYCDKCHIADYDRFYTNQEFGRTQEEEQLSLQYVNDLRESLGLKKMRLNSYTTAVAKERAKELITDFSHNKARTGVNENIATCSGGAKRAFEMWKESSGHYYNMTYDDLMYFGYAYAVVPPASSGTHWRLVMIQTFKMMRF